MCVCMYSLPLTGAHHEGPILWSRTQSSAQGGAMSECREEALSVRRSRQHNSVCLNASHHTIGRAGKHVLREFCVLPGGGAVSFSSPKQENVRAVPLTLTAYF